MPARDERELDLVLFGATGFVGGLTADYLAEHAPDGLRWALAGRNGEKLAAVRDRLTATHPDCADLPLLTVDSADAAGLADLAGRTRLVVSTVGPYLLLGEPLVAACAEAGTDYVDLTGEPEFVDQMWLRYHETAVASGARLVHCCGFDSVPHDLGAMFTVSLLPEGEPIRLRGVVRSNAQMSGGTFHSALNQMSRMRLAKAAAQARRRAEPRPEGRSSRPVAGKPHRDPVLGYWLLPLPTIDPFIVARSGAALASYGPDFRYSHYAGTKTLRYAATGVATVGALGVAAQVGPLRELLGRRLQPGEGPSERRREKSWFTVDFIGEAGGRVVHTRVSGGDPGYTDTAMMLAESALCLLEDDLPDRAGQLTPAVAMGEHLLDRLQRAGMGFESVR